MVRILSAFFFIKPRAAINQILKYVKVPEERGQKKPIFE